MKPSTFILVACAAQLLFAGALPAGAAGEELKLWPREVPGDADFKAPAPNPKARPPKNDDTIRIASVTEPTLTLFRAPADKANGAAVLICPGGGYNILAWNKEGTEVAEWLNSLGVTAAVLKYRVPRRDKDTPHTAPLQDAQRGLRLMRQHSGDWGIDARRIGILGFSAGGHLTVMAGTHWSDTTYPKQDAADELSCRPDFMIPIYPAYLGDERNAGPLSPLVHVTNDTPPTFCAVTHDDQLRGVNAALFYVELKKAGVPAELHIYAKGGHGYGLRPSENPVSQWPQRCADWLRAMRLLDSSSKP
jgi:acetyl esterase/lipase